MKKANKKQITKVLGIGKVDFNFTLELSDQDAEFLNTSIDSLDSIESLKILSNKPEIWDKISLTSSSQIISSFLYINKVSKHKIFIEFASLAPISFSEEEMFLKPILTYVAEHNFLFINENDILPFYKTTVTLNIKKGSKIINTFNLCQNENSNINRSNAPEDATMYEKLICDYSQFNYLFIDLNEFVDLSHLNIGFSDVLNLLSTIDRFYKDLLFVVYFPAVIANISMLNLDSINQLTEILSYSDTVIFQKKEAIAFFTLLQQFSSQAITAIPNSIKNKAQFKTAETAFNSINFRRKISKKHSKGSSRIGIFIDDLSYLNIIECSRVGKDSHKIFEYKFNLIPKLNQANKKLIEEYKRQFEVNQNFLTSVFFGGFLSKFFNTSGYETAFVTASEITKRCLDLFKLGLEFPLDAEFYYVSPNKTLIREYKEKQIQQEKGFVLDCTNLNTSKLNFYNPLFDANLSSFFSSQVVRKHLNEQGFINTRGFLLLDTSKKKNTLLVDKSSDKYLKKDKNIMIAVKENSAKMNIENVEKILKFKSKALNDPSISQLELLAQTLSFSPLKNKQLPSYNESGYYFKHQGKVKLQPLKMSKTSNDVFKKEKNDKGKSKLLYIKKLQCLMNQLKSNKN